MIDLLTRTFFGAEKCIELTPLVRCIWPLGWIVHSWKICQAFQIRRMPLKPISSALSLKTDSYEWSFRSIWHTLSARFLCSTGTSLNLIIGKWEFIFESHSYKIEKENSIKFIIIFGVFEKSLSSMDDGAAPSSRTGNLILQSHEVAYMNVNFIIFSSIHSGNRHEMSDTINWIPLACSKIEPRIYFWKVRKTTGHSSVQTINAEKNYIKSKMPAVPGSMYGASQQQPSCFSKMKYGFTIGFCVGMASGALFGGFSALR